MKPKPCPFCRSENTAYEFDEIVFIYCADCGANGPAKETADEALAAWNTRPQEKEEKP